MPDPKDTSAPNEIPPDPVPEEDIEPGIEDDDDDPEQAPEDDDPNDETK